MRINGTRFEFTAAGAGKSTGEALIVPLPSQPKPAMRLLSAVDRLCDGAVSELVELAGVPDDVGRLLHTTRRTGFRRVLAVSIGDDARLTPDKLRQAAAKATGWLVENRLKQATLWIDALLSCNFDAPVAEWAVGMALAGFRFEELKRANDKRPPLVRVALRSSEGEHVTRCLAEVRQELRVAEAVNFAREVAHRPPNVLFPAALAAEARRLARSGRLRCQVIDSAQAARMGMNGLLAVGRGSEHKPCLIRLDYRGNPRSQVNTVIVGKAITFDSGGISIKPSSGMEKMKFDKCGGMAVLGVMKAVADLRLRCNVTGLIAAAENLLSDEAYRPSDIIRMMSGKTVEVISTDAEGRMVLADALHYAQKHCKPAALIDLATLTGGVIVALGTVAAGLMSNDDALAGELGESGRRTHERLWRLPLWDDYRELIKGTDSDIRNSGTSRGAHPIVGGMFLKEFVSDDVPWAHLDIAGTATSADEKEATGFGVRLLVDYLRRRGGAPAA